MHKELREFYRAYKKWLDAGAPNEEPFDRSYGLCNALYVWSTLEGYSEVTKMELKIYLENEFHSSYTDYHYPFGMREYIKRNNTKTNHLDPNRIAWVEAHI